MRTAFLALFLIVLSGCKGNREKDLVGSWSGGGASITVDAAKTFKTQMGPMALDGTWMMEGDTVTMTPKTMNGRPIAELKAGLLKNAAAVPAQAKGFVEDMDKPNVFTLSADGKTLATDKSKDTNSGPGMTLTKS